MHDLFILRFAEHQDAKGAKWRKSLGLIFANDEPGTLIVALQHVARARGGIDDLGLSEEEKVRIATAIGRALGACAVLQAA
jgi:hypothetical protein